MAYKKTLSFILLLCVILAVIRTEGLEYSFKRYQYRKKKDDKKFRRAKGHCETVPNCQQLLARPLEHTKCVRKCISSNCYEELYTKDELEEGEIDIRLNSFKGCYGQER